MGGDFPIEGDKLRKLIKKSRQMPIPFGFNPGTSEEEDEFLAAHARKAPEILGKLALNEGAGTKSSFGTFAVDGSEVHLTCFRTIPQLAKKFKKYLKRFKITLNCVVMDPDGNVIDSDVETLEDWFQDSDDRDDAVAELEEAAADADASDDAGIDAGELAARLKALQPRIAGARPDVLDRVTAGFAGAVGLVKDGRLEAASIAIAQLEAIMARLAAVAARGPAPAAPPAQTAPPAAPEQAEDPRGSRLREAADKLSRKVEAQLGKAGAPLLDDLARADGLIDADQPEAALQTLRRVQDELRTTRAAQAKWRKVHAALDPVIRRALDGGGVADAGELRARWNEATIVAEQDDWQRALDFVPRIIGLLREPA